MTFSSKHQSGSIRRRVCVTIIEGFMKKRVKKKEEKKEKSFHPTIKLKHPSSRREHLKHTLNSWL